MQSHSTTLALNVLLIEEDDGRWSAQCLEHDIVAQANKFSELSYEVEKVLVAYLTLSAANGEEPFAGLPRAPQEFWDMYDRSETEVRVREPKVPITAPTQTPTPVPNFRVAQTLASLAP